MTLSIRPANPARPDFVGEATGVDIRAGVSAAEAAAIEAGMDRYGVLVFRGQDIDDAQQIAFSRHFGPLELATGDIVQGGARRLSMEVNDISNLHQDGSVAADPRAPLQAGDEIMVLPRIETKRIEVTRGITQILYHIAVAAKVVFGL